MAAPAPTAVALPALAVPLAHAMALTSTVPTESEADLEVRCGRPGRAHVDAHTRWGRRTRPV